MEQAKTSSEKKDIKGQSYPGVSKNFERPARHAELVKYRYTFRVTGKMLRENDLYERQNS